MNYFHHYHTTVNLTKNKKTKLGGAYSCEHLCTRLLSNTQALFLLGERTDGYPHSTFLSYPQNTHVVRPQRHAASAAGTEFGAAVGAEVAAPISKLCFVTDATSRSVVFVLALATPCLFPYFSHLFLIAFKLLMQSPGERENGSKLNKWWKTIPSQLFELKQNIESNLPTNLSYKGKECISMYSISPNFTWTEPHRCK